MLIINEPEHVEAELCADCSREQEADLFQHTAHLILQVTTNADKPGSRDKDGAENLAGLALDADLTVPANPDELCKTSSVVRVALVHPEGKSGMGMARINTDDRQIDALQLVPEPTRHRASLESNPFGSGRPFADDPSECARFGGSLTLEQDLAILIHDTHRRLLLRHI